MAQKSPKLQQHKRRDDRQQEEPFVPPETPDPVPEPEDRPAKPEAIDSDFTPEVETPDAASPKRKG